MGKEKNIQQPVIKKERTSILEKIRKRTGLLVGIVGLALLIFILESLLGSGASIFGGNEMSTVGTINGKKVDRNDFVLKLENQLNNYRQRNQKSEVDDNTRTGAIENVWNQYIVELIIKPQFKKAGISVGEDEIYDKVVANPVQSILQQLSDPKTGKLSEQFALPDGSLDLVKWKQAVQNLPADQESALLGMEENVKSTRYFEKYRSLFSKGIYVTSSEAKENLKNINTSYNVSYVINRFDAIPDASIQITDEDLQKYYKNQNYEFGNPQTTRQIEYVSFNLLPSAADVEEIKKDAQRAASEFKGKTASEDSLFITQENEGNKIQDYTKKTMPIQDSSVFKSAPGTVFGPYNEGAFFKIYKLQATNLIADSAKVRHILLALTDPDKKPKRSREQAKKQADSLLVLINTKKNSFDSLVKTVSDDMGSKTNGGDYGWFDEEKGFVKEYKNAGLRGTKGNISVVETQFGFHIIEVLDVSKTKHFSYTIAEIFKSIAPSEETKQKIFAQANQFVGQNNTADLFDKAVAKEKLTKRLLDNIKESDRALQNLDKAKELVRWVYNSNKGDVNTFSFDDKHIVAKLSGIKNKGLLPIEDVSQELTLKVKKQKKSERFLQDFNTKTGNSKTIEAIAKNLKLEIKNQERLLPETHNVDGLGHDDIFIGTITGIKAGSLSKPTVGENGVFVAALKAINSIPAQKDIKLIQREIEETIKTQLESELFEALKEISDIQDHTSRVD